MTVQPSMFPEYPDAEVEEPEACWDPQAPNRVALGDDYYPYVYPVPVAYQGGLLATEDDKWAVLAGIGIRREADESPLVAWRNAVADASGIDRADLDPKQGGVLDTGFSPAYVRKFVLFLA